MSERDKLVELLENSEPMHCIYDDEIDCNKCNYKEKGCFDGKLADYLIANGVTIPVRCCECEHYSAERKDDKYGVCRYWQYYMDAPEVWADDFCCHGERRADNGT